MKGFIKHGLIFLLALFILLALNGINIYLHHCDCSHSTKVSIFPLDIDCCEDQQPIHACSSEIKSSSNCCNSEIQPENHVPQKKLRKKCCYTSLQSFKIDQLFFNNMLKINFNPFHLFCLFKNTDEYTFRAQALEGIHINNDIPPPIFGKHLIYFIQQLKLDTHI